MIKPKNSFLGPGMNIYNWLFQEVSTTRKSWGTSLKAEKVKHKAKRNSFIYTGIINGKSNSSSA